jgi:hypothetical protein
MQTKISELCQKVAVLRHNPVLCLKLEDLERPQAIQVYYELKGKKIPKLDVVLHTAGGDADATFLITKILHLHAEEVSFIVPLFAKSAGTIMCLGADELILSELSELGPLDVQIREQQEGQGPRFSSALNGFKALEQVQLHTIQTLDLAAKMILQRTAMRLGDAIHLAAEFAGQTSGTLYSQVDPKKIGEYARALGIGEKYGMIILTRFMKWPSDKAHSTIRRLVQEYPSHDFVIDYHELKELGLPAVLAEGELNDLLDEFCQTFLAFEGGFIKFFPAPVSNPASVSPPGASEEANVEQAKTLPMPVN